MQVHNGMRPQDVAILLKIVALDTSDWQVQAVSTELKISMGEISQSLNRSRLAGLIGFRKKDPNRHSLAEFIIHGLKYVFPQAPGPLSRGLATAHSHPFMKRHFHSEANYVWPDVHGEMMGESIKPFYKRQVEAALIDEKFYLLLALADTIRVGRVREAKVAADELKRLLTQ